MDCQFSFGPNGAFFFRINNNCARSINNTLPEPVRASLEDKNHARVIQVPYDVAFPMEPGMFTISWQTVQGEIPYDRSHLGPQYTKLVAFMHTSGHARQHTKQTVFGPNSSYFTGSPSGFSWQHLPSDLETSITGRVHVSRPTCVALGAHGSFVVLFKDGVRIFEGLKHYPAVEALVRQSKEIAYISLNPHEEGMYFAAFSDGTASWSLPNEWIQAVRNVCGALSPPPSSPIVGWSSPPGSPMVGHGFHSPPPGFSSPPPSFNSSPPGFPSPPHGFYSPPPSFHSPPLGSNSSPPNFHLAPPSSHSPPLGWHSPPVGSYPPPSLVGSHSQPVGSHLYPVAAPRISMAMLEAVNNIWSLYNHTQHHSAVSSLGGNNFAASGSAPQALIADPSNASSNAFFADPSNMPIDPSNVPSGAFIVDPSIMPTGAFIVDPSNIPLPPGAFIFDPSNFVPAGFDPSPMVDFASGLDPGILGSFIGALDPSSVIDGIATIFGNY